MSFYLPHGSIENILIHALQIITFFTCRLPVRTIVVINFQNRKLHYFLESKELYFIPSTSNYLNKNFIMALLHITPLLKFSVLLLVKESKVPSQ